MSAASRPWLKIFGALAGGLLLFAAYAPFDVAPCAWFAFIPLLLAIRGEGPACAFRLGWISGAAFWIPSLAWLSRVSVAGWIVLACYCALYTGAFAWGIALWTQRFGAGRIRSNIGLMVFGAAWWVGLEWVRSTFGTGFAWNALGVSQHDNIPILQLASLGGVYAVSALVMFMNLAVGSAALRFLEERGLSRRRPHLELVLGVAVLALAMFWGVTVVRGHAGEGRKLRIALIQTNIPQDEKWDQEKITLIYRRLVETTQQAIAMRPDLIIWPETALPDDVRTSEPSYRLVYELATSGAPILVGSMDTAWEDVPRYYNSSFLFDTNGVVVGQYDKQHLVIFGEYVPLNDVLPFLKAMTPIEASFTGGTNSTVFVLEPQGARFASLICFEDTVAPLARRAVKNGARMLVNQTNDAWFDPLWAPWQHMAHSVLRAVENRVPVVRSANTGVTCHIDEFGRLRAVLLNEHGGTRFAGFKSTEVQLAPDDMTPTLYTRVGDLPAISAGVFALAMLLVLRFGLRGQDHPAT